MIFITHFGSTEEVRLEGEGHWYLASKGFQSPSGQIFQCATVLNLGMSLYEHNKVMSSINKFSLNYLKCTLLRSKATVSIYIKIIIKECDRNTCLKLYFRWIITVPYNKITINHMWLFKFKWNHFFKIPLLWTFSHISSENYLMCLVVSTLETKAR